MPGKRIPNLIRCFITPRIFYTSGEFLLRPFCQPQADLRLNQEGPKIKVTYGGLLFEGLKDDLCPFFLIKKDQKIKAQQKFD